MLGERVVTGYGENAFEICHFVHVMFLQVADPGKPRVAVTNKPVTEQTCITLTLVLVGVLSGRDVTKLG